MARKGTKRQLEFLEIEQLVELRCLQLVLL